MTDLKKCLTYKVIMNNENDYLEAVNELRDQYREMKAKWEKEKASLLLMIGGNVNEHYELIEEKKIWNKERKKLKLIIRKQNLKIINLQNKHISKTNNLLKKVMKI
tara:strand:- start:925 stop:1242 length:318 start_codon:yes stop_codon:yes gene_type:complete